MADEPLNSVETAPKPKVDGRSSRKRRAKPNWKARKEATIAKQLAKRREIEERIAAREAERQKKIEEAKAAIQALIDADNAKRDQAAASKLPVDIIDLLKLNNLPLDTPYHPRYNLIGVPPDRPLQQVECIAFGRDWPAEYGGLGSFLHLKNFIQATWPTIEFNPWLEDQLRSLCDSSTAVQIGSTKLKFINWVGSGSAGKTFASGLFACAWYMVDFAAERSPRTSITITSTSKGIIRQRVWPVIQKLFHEAKNSKGDRLKWGHLIDSQTMLCPLSANPGEEKKRDYKNSICALAVESGELIGALDKIKGRHTERMMLIVDEANSTPQAIFECIPNMLTSVRELIVLVIGNAGSRLDPHGQCCEPRRGWKSITIEDTIWETKGVAKWGIGPGVCLHFDGAKSPNVIAGKTEHKHIYSFERWQQVLRMGDEYRNTLQHWSQDRGFWPPDGLVHTVFTEAMVVRHDGTGVFSWHSNRIPIASLDPAFGGDNCLLTLGSLGDINSRTKGLQIMQHLLVPFNPDSPDAVDYQIAVYVIRKCKEWGVEPKYFGLDATGIGRGVAAFISQLWSPQIVSVEFGSAASEMPASVTDPRRSCEVYSNKVTELWYSCQEILLSDQLKGLYPEAITEFCNRLFFYESKRYKLETKPDMKKRIGYSPDHADAIAILCDVARRNGLVPMGVGGAQLLQTKVQSNWQSITRSLENVVSTDYTEAPTFEQYAEVA